MDRYKSIDELVEEKRKAMMYLNEEITIDSIYDEIKKMAENMTLESPIMEVSCDIFFKVGDNEFVKLLYHNILLREPDFEGYIHNLNSLLNGSCSRTQMISAFADSPEAKRNNIKIVGLEKRITKDRISRTCKRIPGVGYICRLVSNIVFLSRRIASLYQSCNLLIVRCENLESQCRNERLETNALAIKCKALEGKFKEYEKQNQIYKEFISNQLKKEEIKGEEEKVNKALCDTFYVHYNEKLLPDSREEVKKHALPYIERLNKWCDEFKLERHKLKFIDLGCGECEWIELLSENGFSSIGVDSNDAVRNKVKEQCPNVEIVKKDAIQYLKECKDNSIDCISSLHMVEHMDFITIITLLKECYRVLKKGGMLIVETPNPQNILTASYYFYLDPTHVKPIPPELMQFYFEESGFEIYDKLLFNPLNFEPYEYRADDQIKDIVFRFNMEQAYSIMAVKR